MVVEADIDGDVLRSARLPGYESERPDIQALVPLGVSRVLDLGCSSGRLGAAVKARTGAEVVGLEFDPVLAAEARERLDDVRVVDLTRWTADEASSLGSFDCVIAADVLEHLPPAEEVLGVAAQLLRPGGVAIVSVPNVRHWTVLRALLIRGRWPREDQGIFDRTHMRWFTSRDAADLVAGAGLSVTEVRPGYRARRGTTAFHRALSRVGLRPYVAFQTIVCGQRTRG